MGSTTEVARVLAIAACMRAPSLGSEKVTPRTFMESIIGQAHGSPHRRGEMSVSRAARHCGAVSRPHLWGASARQTELISDLIGWSPRGGGVFPWTDRWAFHNSMHITRH